MAKWQFCYWCNTRTKHGWVRRNFLFCSPTCMSEYSRKSQRGNKEASKAK